MELRHLRYFVAVAEELNFTRAAERLMISQPPLSMQIRDLERELDTPLFVRTRRSVRLTAAGEELYRRASAILRQVEVACDKVARVGLGEEGDLRLGFLASSTGPLLSELVRRFSAAHPGVRLEVAELTPAELVEHLRLDRLDLVVTRPEPRLTEDDSLAWQLLFRDPLVLAVSDDYLPDRRGRVPLEDLQPARLVSLYDDMSGYFNGLVARAVTPTRLTFENRLQVRSIAAMLWSISLGLGVGFLTEQSRDLRWRGVRYLRLAGEVPAAETLLAWNPARATPAVKNFLTLVEG